ncbi:hypothetical protein JP35_08465 [Gallibacterium anatis]|uniref:hypothetical protein n=1 Tax=Gallibacterium anatis TaxID=750 RepID=UPI0005320662|nr:hypothetical protein [Gallibacterium anatis]KGQ38158.1 hypothetical protein JP35_08465 [Gallibacterium anatis]
MDKKGLATQLETLESDIKNLHQVATLIHVLAYYSDLKKFDYCELEEALKGINTALYSRIDSLNRRVNFIKEELEANK